jgi:hypothetical protein
MEKHRELAEENNKKLSRILTAEQQKSFEEMKTSGKGRMKRHPRPGMENRVRK